MTPVAPEGVITCVPSVTLPVPPTAPPAQPRLLLRHLGVTMTPGGHLCHPPAPQCSLNCPELLLGHLQGDGDTLRGVTCVTLGVALSLGKSPEDTSITQGATGTFQVSPRGWDRAKVPPQGPPGSEIGDKGPLWGLQGMGCDPPSVPWCPLSLTWLRLSPSRLALMWASYSWNR